MELLWNSQQRYGHRFKMERLLNINVRGRFALPVSGLPKTDICEKATKSSFIKKIARSGIAMQNPNGIREPMDGGLKYFEAVPTMDCCDEFKEAVLSIPIGIVSQVTQKRPTASSLKQARYVTEASKLLERIEVLMRI